MPTKYTYKAKNTSGQDVSGIVEADSQKIAVSLLKDRGYIVYSLAQKKEGIQFNSLTRIGGVSDLDVVNFTQSLSSMTKAGLPLAQALEILADQSKSEKLKEIVQTALKDVESGTSLSESLSKNPDVFPPSYISILQAGEASGKLGDVLDRLGHTLEKRREFKSKVKGALIYPSIVVTAMVAVFILLLVFVVPKLVEMYDSFGVELPFFTRAMIWASDFIRGFWYILVPAAFGAVFALKSYNKTDAGNIMIARLQMKIPIFGKIIRERDITEFSRSLALLMTSGVSIIDALSITRDAVGNRLFKDDIAQFVNEVRKGSPLSGALKKSTNFPIIVSKLVQVGEETGTTDQSLTNLSDYYEKEVDNKVKNLSTALEPIIMVVLGVMVGGLLISVITPIYGLMSQF